MSIRQTKVVEISPEANVLPPDYGPFNEFRVADYFCPEEWTNNGIFIPVKEGDPFWIDFRGNWSSAVIPSVQRVNPITGESCNIKDGVKKDPKQNYLVLPRQKWIDGYVKEGKVYQFIVTKAGIGLAVNEYLLPVELQDSHALGFAFFLPKRAAWEPEIVDGRIDRTSYSLGNPMWFSPLHTPQNWQINSNRAQTRSIATTGGYVHTSSTITVPEFTLPKCNNADIAEVEEQIECFVNSPDTTVITNHSLDYDACDKASIGAGGRIEQDIIVDPNTPEFYNEKPDATLTVYLALPELFKQIMSKGRRQDANRKDKYVHSGELNGAQIPLIMVS